MNDVGGGRRPAPLIGAGAGHVVGDALGRAPIGPANAGTAPEDIDTVVITHGHDDSAG